MTGSAGPGSKSIEGETADCEQGDEGDGDSRLDTEGIENELDLVTAFLNFDRAEQVIGAQDGFWPTVHKTFPPRVVNLAQKEKARGL